MRKKVIITNSLYTPYIKGGAEISTQILAETLSEEYEVHVITVGLHKRSEGIKKEVINNVQIHRLPYNNIFPYLEKQQASNLKKIIWQLIDTFNFAQYYSILKLLKSIRPNLVHSQNMSGISLALWKAVKKQGIPLVHTLRDYTLLTPVNISFYAKLYQKFAAYHSNKVDSVVGITNFIFDRHAKAGLFGSSKKYVVHNVVDYERYNFKQAKPKHLPLTIGCFGQLEKVKGVEYVIQAMKSLPDTAVIELLLVGDGSEKESLKKLADEDSRIKFLGHVGREEVMHRMREIDLCIVPSVWPEPFGRVIIEAYRSGTPVIGTRTGGIPEIIYRPDTFLVEPQSSEDIKKAILHYWGMDIHQKQEIIDGVLQYSDQFTRETLLENHKALYQELIKESSDFLHVEVPGSSLPAG